MLACKDRSPSRPRLARLHAALARAWRGSSRFARTHWAQPRLSYEIRVGMRCKQSGLDRLEPWRGLLCLSRGVTVGRSHTVNNRVQALTRRVTADHAAHAAHAPGCSRRDFVVYAPRLVSTQNRNFSHFRFCHMCQMSALPLRPAQCSKHRAADVQCRCTGMVRVCVLCIKKVLRLLVPAIEPRTNYLSRSVRPAPPYCTCAEQTGTMFLGPLSEGDNQSKQHRYRTYSSLLPGSLQVLDFRNKSDWNARG